MTGRGVAIVAAFAAVAFIAVKAAEPLIEPPPRAIGSTSYSARLMGHRALLEVLQRLGAQAERWRGPPQGLWKSQRRIALIEPDPSRLLLERAHLDALADWVRRGGELTVVLPVDYRRRITMGVQEAREMALPSGGLSPFFEILGFEGVRHHTAEAAPMGRFAVAEERAGGFIEETTYSRPGLDPVPISAEGELAFAAEDVEELRLPASGFACVEPPEDASYAGRIMARTGEILALRRHLGAGVVTLVAEPAPFQNAGLGEGSNSVFAARVVAGPGLEPVIIDEYYHGLAVQGNTFALLTRYPYSVAGFGALAAAALALWRFGFRFGPVAPDRGRSRRSIAEYVGAMARLFQKGRKYRFALETLRAGVLEDIRRALGLAPGTNPGVVAGIVRNRRPEAGARLEQCLKDIDRALSNANELDDRTVLPLEERLSKCRNEIIMRHRPETVPNPRSNLG